MTAAYNAVVTFVPSHPVTDSMPFPAHWVVELHSYTSEEGPQHEFTLDGINDERDARAVAAFWESGGARMIRLVATHARRPLEGE
jgi:hypothetical protein